MVFNSAQQILGLVSIISGLNCILPSSFIKSLKKANAVFFGVLNCVKDIRKGVCTMECNFVYYAAYRSSA